LAYGAEGAEGPAAPGGLVIQLGDIRVHILSDGRFALDGGAMFGVVPRVMWERTNPPDSKKMP
jgi:hypothetical protein